MSWVALDKKLSTIICERLPPLLKVDLRTFFARAGMQFRVSADRLVVRASSNETELVYRKPLQRQDGAIRADAGPTLARGCLDETLGIGSRLVQLRLSGRLEVTPQGKLQYDLFTSTDPVAVLRRYVDGTGLQAFRVGAHPRLFHSLMLWTILDQLSAGIDPAALKIGANRSDSTLVTGVWQIAPAPLVCFPLLARFQPLAMVAMTDAGAQVALTPPAGGGFVRTTQISSWPVGSAQMSLEGPGLGIYRTTVQQFPADHGPVMLEHCVGGANRLLSWLTDPAAWQDDGGELATMERWIVWASVQQGVDALVSMAADWQGPSTLWTALRALGILQGIWEGKNQGAVPLGELLSPQRLRDYAAPNIPDVVQRRWTLGIIKNWEGEIAKLFPGMDRAQALSRLAEVRHLIHGVGGQGRRSRDVRLEVLRAVADTQPNLQLVKEVAVIWWSALLFAPNKICTPGHAPW